MAFTVLAMFVSLAASHAAIETLSGASIAQRETILHSTYFRKARCPAFTPPRQSAHDLPDTADVMGHGVQFFMTKHMLIDATHAEETRVVVMNGKRIDDYDVETSARRQLKGNIYLAKIIRVEPSLQAAFVDYGGNRHGFLAFSEIHPDYFQIPVADREKLLALQEEEYAAEQQARNDHADMDNTDDSEAETDEDTAERDERLHRPETFSGEHDTGDEHAASRRTARFLRNYRIQEVIRRRQIILVQVVKEERGNKGAALTTYISLAGRYCVLMPNAMRGGGVSRKITSDTDRKRLRDIISQLDLPRSMAMIIRTAGAGRPGPEIVRDCDYLLQLWDNIRQHALTSIAPTLVYEEASLIKRAIRDLFTRDIEDVIIDGELAWRNAREFTRQLMPHNASKVKVWQNRGHSLFSHYNVESHLDAMFSPVVRLESGGYLVINQTEALVSIDVNSGKSTAQRHIEDTALCTNLEAAEEVARQLRLRDLAGLIVIDFIDMESHRHNAKVEKRLKEALRLDRARIQIGRISHFGLLEMSRQRLRPSLAETMFSPCPHCQGTGTIRGIESTALHVLRCIEEEASQHRQSEIHAHVAPGIALYMLNHKRDSLAEIEARHHITLLFQTDNSMTGANVHIERGNRTAPRTEVSPQATPASNTIRTIDIIEGKAPTADTGELEADTPLGTPLAQTDETGEAPRRRRRRSRRRGQNRGQETQQDTPDTSETKPTDEVTPQQDAIPDKIELMPGRRRTRTRRKTDDNPAPRENATQAGPSYTGPTPADPYAGFNIFEAIEQESPTLAAPSLPMPPDASNEGTETTKPRRHTSQGMRSRKTRSTQPSSDTVTEHAVTDDTPSAEQLPTPVEEPKKPRRRRSSTKATKPAATETQAPASTDTPADTTGTAEKPARKQRATTRRKKTDDAENTPKAKPIAAENIAAPQPINVDDTAPAKRRIGWWKR